MPGRSFGGVTWNDQEATPYHSASSQAMSLGVAAGLGGIGLYGATRNLAGGVRPIDHIAAISRTAGNLSPFQLFNTFRVPELASPFTSLAYKTGSEGVEGVTVWGKDFLKTESTYEWLKYTTGKTEAELRAAGISRGMKATENAADAVLWQQKGTRTSGELYSVFGGSLDSKTGQWTGGTKKLLTRDASLVAIGHEIVNPLTQERGMNRIATGMLDAANMGSKVLGGDGREFSHKDLLVRDVWDPVGKRMKSQQAPFMFMPSMSGAIESVADLGRRTNFVRGIAAFEMDRFNRLISGVSEQFLGDKGGKAFQKILGVQPGVRSGPASAMLARFGGRAAAAGGIYMGVQQTDWMRRNFSWPGEMLASGLVSGGLAYGLGKLGSSPRTAAMAGVASFFGQMVLPGFDQGVWAGMSTTAVNMDIARANVLNPFNYLRRTLEGFAPGASDWETGALFAVSALGAASVQLPSARGTVAQQLLQGAGPGRLGLLMDPGAVNQVGQATQGVRRRFWERMSGLSTGGAMPHSSIAQRTRMMRDLHSQFSGRGDSIGFFRQMNTQWYQAERDIEKFAKANPLNNALERRLQQISNKYAGNNLVDSIQREVRGAASQAYYSFFGADLGVDKAMRERIQDMGFGAVRSSKGHINLPTGVGRWGRWGSIGAAAFAAHGLLTGGFLGSKETSDDLRDIYSGKKHIAVKKSRWWEAGGTPFAGGDDEYYRPHQYHLMMNRSREAGIWGPDEDSISPIGKFFRKNFTYQLEESQYWNRPYPMSSAAFADVPIIGGVLASTVGKLIKPARVMHAGEWIRPGAEGGLEYASVYQGSRREPAMALGAHHGIPQDPYGLGSQASYLSYQFRELEGMTGWAKNVIQQSITGEDVWGSDNPTLADASLMSSARVRFWEGQMGGALFTNEFVRRILPRYRSEIERVNPLANNMPSWLPDKFHWGDPYRNVEWGEARLPGAGYAALHPELRGMDSEAYPLIHRYAIMSDVAPMSPEYNMLKQQVYKKRADGAFSQREVEYMEQIDARHRRVVSGFRDDRLHERAVRMPGSGATRGAWAFSQRQLRNVAAPAEYLVPMGFRPVQKLMGNRDPIEQYEYERLYGTPMAFWDKPWRDWLRPSAYSAAHMMGWDGSPMWRKEADATNEYFDKLEFIKYMSLADGARAAGDNAAAQRYRFAASNTRQGVNPQGSPLGLYWTLPGPERKFFNAFAHASGKERHRILEMVPSDQRHLYKALWSRMDSGDPGVWAGAPAAIDDKYMAAQYASARGYMEGRPQPNPDWIGWHEDVDIDDIQVRYLDRTGAELHDYGMWESQLKKSMQQPFLEGSSDFMGGGNMALNLSLRGMTGIPGNRGSWQIAPSAGTMSSVQIGYDDNRQHDISSAVERYIGGF